MQKLKDKLVEAAAVYRKDKETLDWHVMQDPKVTSSDAGRLSNPLTSASSAQDDTKFAIVERYEQESSQQYHLNNPYWKTFDPYVIPLLAKPMDLTRWEEM